MFGFEFGFAVFSGCAGFAEGFVKVGEFGAQLGADLVAAVRLPKEFFGCCAGAGDRGGVGAQEPSAFSSDLVHASGAVVYLM